MISEFDKRRKVIVSALNQLKGISCNEPAGAFYAFPNISETGLSSLEAQDIFLDEAGVATIAGTSFGQYGEEYLRLSYANSQENIMRAIERIDKILS